MNKVLFAVIGVLILYVINLYTTSFIHPNTFLARVDISKKTEKSLQALLTKETQKKIKIQVQDRLYTYSYDDLGILLNTQEAFKEAISSHNPVFSVIHYIQAHYNETVISPPYIFTQKFYSLFMKATFPFKDPDTGNLTLYRIDPEALRTSIMHNFGSDEVIMASLQAVEDTKEDPEILAKRIEHIYEKPIDVVFTHEGKSRSIAFDTGDVKGISTAFIDPETTDVQVKIDKRTLDEFLTTNVKTIEEEQKGILSEEIGGTIEDIISARAYGFDSYVAVMNSLELYQNQNEASKYIKIDLSERMLVMVDQKRVVNSYPFFLDVCEKAEPGTYTIMQKREKTYSTFDNVYMPFWSEFTRNDEGSVLFGIHEVPYQNLNEKNGENPRADEEQGSPRTCIALPVGSAAEVYAFAEEGLKVVISQ